MAFDSYFTVTELPGNIASGEQLERMYQRYFFAREMSRGKDVLELACGGGMGLGFLAGPARKVVGSDIDEEILKVTRGTYKGRDNISVLSMNAQNIACPDGSFDVVLLYEAIYYLPDAAGFVREAARVLRPGGALVICSVNREWTDFNASPFSRKYYSIPELYELVKGSFPSVQMFGAYDTSVKTAGDIVVSLIKRMAVSLHLIPRTMKGKALLKKLFLGGAKPVPREINEGMAVYVPPTTIPPCSHKGYKVIFAVGRK